MILHLKAPLIFDFLICNNIKSIIFLSRLLTPAETISLPIKLEMACIVWVFRKTCHLVKLAESPKMVYINYKVSLEIAK